MELTYNSSGTECGVVPDAFKGMRNVWSPVWGLKHIEENPKVVAIISKSYFYRGVDYIYRLQYDAAHYHNRSGIYGTCTSVMNWLIM